MKPKHVDTNAIFMVVLIPMYAGEDWIQFGDEYDVKGIGQHLSMWKMLDGEDSD